MSDIRIFNNPEFGEVRTIVIDGEPWFVGKDVASSLGYSKTDGMMRLVDEEDKRNISSADLGEQVYKQSYTLGIVNESGIYAAIFGSKLESAKKFKRWVTSEVLPSLRKNGSYGVPKTIPEQIQLLAQGNVELNQRVNDLSDRMDKIELDLPILPIEADRITEAVRRKGVSAMGGKQSSAYQNRGLRQKVYNNIYANLKYNFSVRSYKAIKRSQCDRAIEIVNEWKPPVFLADEISNCNSQMRFDV